MVKSFLNAGADPEAVNKTGENAIDIAKKRGYNDLLKLLERAAAQQQKPKEKQE